MSAPVAMSALVIGLVRPHLTNNMELIHLTKHFKTLFESTQRIILANALNISQKTKGTLLDLFLGVPPIECFIDTISIKWFTKIMNGELKTLLEMKQRLLNSFQMTERQCQRHNICIWNGEMKSHHF